MDKNIPAGAAILLDFIGGIEAPQGYDTVYGNKQARLEKPLTQWTVGEIIGAKPTFTRRFGSSACGRYQFMNATLKSIVAENAVRLDEVFTPDVQDRLGLHLLRRRGYDRFISGKLSVTAFGKALAQEWASFPVLAACQGAHRPLSRGDSYYRGDGINKVLTTPAKVEEVLRRVRPAADRPQVARKPAQRQGEEHPTISPLPTVPTVPVPPTPVTRPFWQRLLGINRPVPNPRPGLMPNGDPALYDIQATLKSLKYPVGLLDGLMGKNTRAAIRQARIRNGLPDGEHLDDTFKAALPGMRPAEVSEERANASDARLRQEAPEATRQLDGLGWIGKMILAGSGVGSLEAAGALDQAKQLASQGSETLATVQTILTTIISIIQWCVTHWWVLGIVAAIVILWRVAMAGLRLLVLLRQGRLL